MESSASTWLPAVVHRPSIHCDSEFPWSSWQRSNASRRRRRPESLKGRGISAYLRMVGRDERSCWGIFEFIQDSCNDRQQFEATACLLAASHNSMDLWIWRDILGSVKFGCVCFGQRDHGLFFSAWWIRRTSPLKKSFPRCDCWSCRTRQVAFLHHGDSEARPFATPYEKHGWPVAWNS